MSNLIQNIISLIIMLLVLGLYARTPPAVGITNMQTLAGDLACLQHQGTKQYIEQYAPDGYKVECNDGTTIAGKIPLRKTHGATT